MKERWSVTDLRQRMRLSGSRATLLLDDAAFKKIALAKQTASARFLDPKRDAASSHGFSVSTDPLDNVTAVGIGPRLRSGQILEEWCVRIYVEHKLERAALRSDLVLPTHVEGVPVDVIESGRFSTFLVPVQRQRRRPAQPGCSVGAKIFVENRLTVGTLGALAEHNGNHYILSNKHVLDPENSSRLGIEIFQPGLLDDLNDSNPEPIARLTKFVPLRWGQSNSVDCAIAEILHPGCASPIFLPPVDRLSSTEPSDPVLGMSVEKVGRTSGHTTGEIFGTDVDVKVAFLSGTYKLQNQFLVQADRRAWPNILTRFPRPWSDLLAKLRVFGDRQPFSEPGDSGSVVVDRSSKRAVGLLVGGSPNRRLSIVSPMRQVLSELGIALIV